jgi:PAS domain-containing protein
LPSEAYLRLLNQYKKLYRQSIRLVNMGDRMQGQLNRLYEQLARSEEKYRSIFERSIQGIFRSTAAGCFLDLNPAMARMFGYESAEEMICGVRDIETQIYYSGDSGADFCKPWNNKACSRIIRYGCAAGMETPYGWRSASRSFQRLGKAAGTGRPGGGRNRKAAPA